MNTRDLARALEIVHRHDAEEQEIAVEHDVIWICGDMPFTDDEKAELDALGFFMRQGAWKGFV